jgi:hypothetical protein
MFYRNCFTTQEINNKTIGPKTAVIFPSVSKFEIRQIPIANGIDNGLASKKGITNHPHRIERIHPFNMHRDASKADTPNIATKAVINTCIDFSSFCALSRGRAASIC